MQSPLPYDKGDKNSILTYAKLLENRSLRTFLSCSKDDAMVVKLGKGSLGNMVEEFYFGYRPNSDAQADFPDAGIELKTSPLKRVGKELVSKERLVFNIINYMEEHKTMFRTSSFWKKNAELLLLFYIHDKEQQSLDYEFKYVSLWRFPETDLKIIIDDWNTIVRKIKEGRAHEISEGDTLYLGACTKGATKASVRQQPFSDIPAMQRAFSLKSKYLNYIIKQIASGMHHVIDEGEYAYLLSESSLPRDLYESANNLELGHTVAAVESLRAYKNGQTFEELVCERFDNYIGWSESDLMKHFDLKVNLEAKNRYNVICNRIMGVEGKYIEEFVKGDIEMKTIILEHNGSLRESMSFQQIKYKEIIYEEWLSSYWYETLTKRFFIVVFQRDEQRVPRLLKVLFWTMPHEDLAVAERFWENTKANILNGDFNNFVKLSDNMICHVRPKARNAQDLMETASGTFEKKKAYWLNNAYIKSIIS